ncbi:hypothetical protein [Vibrio genomosp. F10]|uniref:hypothetical protein n=1 Tax=Vibrio genomosp. F10 TaxID=723171 RepID=UPI0002E8E3E1|nr:hypothetical protein [Vibrio genomosp. F10]OEF04183.1 hypothetical protein A1QI_11865 [Vibrio genomosp. F10 str. 9ZB36]
MKKTNLLWAMMATLTLSACGSDDNENVAAPSASGSGNEVYKAIDGYLIGADVYVDRNKNRVADGNELLPAKTDENGEFVLDEADKQYPVIIRAVAGQTYDSDKAGRLKSSFEFIADSRINLVTPFSTIASNENLSLEELASQVNLPVEVIEGDYVSQKVSSGNSDVASQAHALARALTQVIGSDDVPQSEFMDVARSIKSEIDSDVNTGKNLDKLLYKVGSGGVISTVDMPKTLKAHFLEGTFYYVHTNQYEFNDEGIFELDFAETEQTVINGSGRTFTWPIQYFAKGFKVGTDSLDEVIYVSEDITILMTGFGELGFMTKTDVKTGYVNAYQDVTASDYQGKTFYHFWDDSTTGTPNPSFVKLSFAEQGNRLELTENGQTRALDWLIQGNDLVIQGAQDGGDWEISRTTIASEDFIIFNEGRHGTLNVPYFMTENEALAEAIFAEWTK